MQLHQLTVFKAVADTKSFSKAGEDLFLSQSTVSTHISNLEEYFGKKLFDRLGRYVILTPFGERLYVWADKLIGLHNAALDDLKDYTKELRGTLNIAASTVPAQYMAPRVMAAFKAKFPAVNFIIRQGRSEDIAELILKGLADLAIVGDKYYPDKIDYTPFCSERLVLITPPHVKITEPVVMANLKDYNFIFRGTGSGTQATIERFMRQAGVDLAQFSVVAYLDSVQAVKQAVRDGLGVAFISETAARDYADNQLLNVYPVAELGEKRTFYFATNKNRTPVPFANEFTRLGVELFQDSKNS